MPSIAIIGGGLMGTGIAQVFLSAGHRVALFEPNRNARASVMSRLAAGLRLVHQNDELAHELTITETLESAVAGADHVIEAAPEQLALKRSIFAALIKYAPASAILSTNTSVIPIHLIANDLTGSDRIIGTHWWNPPALIPLVEVIPGRQTSDATVQQAMQLLQSVGKSPACVKDTPWFVGNRLQHALWREAIAMVAEGVCDASTLDACVKNSFGLRLAVLGPLENADLIGLDLTRDIHRTMAPTLGHAGAHPYLEALVAAGQLGFKTQQGFLPWTDEAKSAVRRRLTAHLLDATQRTASI